MNTLRPTASNTSGIQAILTAASVKKEIKNQPCPWLTIAGQAGSLEYAENIYDWLEHEFGHGHFCIVADEYWWYCEERASFNINKLVDRFLAWPLPESVCSDGCATQQGYPHRSGTNLLTATEAKQMLEYLLTDVLPVPDASQSPTLSGENKDYFPFTPKNWPT